MAGGRRVQTARRLVEQQDRRPLDDGASNAQSLVHAGGKLHRLFAAEVVEAHITQDTFHPVRAFAAGQIFQGSKKFQILPGGEARKERPLRRQRETNLPADRLGLKPSVSAAYTDPAPILQQLSRKQFQSRAFPPSVMSDKRATFSVL